MKTKQKHRSCAKIYSDRQKVITKYIQNLVVIKCILLIFFQNFHIKKPFLLQFTCSQQRHDEINGSDN